MKPKIAKTLTGKFVVKYRCPNCEDKLVSPLDEVGHEDTCPSCNTKYVVPGQAEKAEFTKRQEADRDAAARKKAEKIAAAEKAAKESSENATQETNAGPTRTEGDSSPKQSRGHSGSGRRQHHTNQLICSNCGVIGTPKTVIRGSVVTEIFLWIICCFLGGLIYTIWRLTTRCQACRSCGAETLLSLNSPMGQKLQDELGHGG